MTEEKADRRVLRTRRALQTAFIQLILEKGYDAVTIEEITDRADLGRTTFYLHFRDKEELLMHAVDTICEDFIDRHEMLLDLVDDPQSAIKNLRLDERILYHIFVHARENIDLYKVMLRGEGGAKASRRFSSVILQEAIRRLQKVPGLKSKVPIKLFAAFFSGTLVEFITWWLEEGQPYSIEEMVRYFQQMFINGALDTLNMAEVRMKAGLLK